MTVARRLIGIAGRRGVRRFVPNKGPGRSAPYLMIGRTKANRPITAAVLYDEVRLAVIPISARESEDWEINKWRF